MPALAVADGVAPSCRLRRRRGGGPPPYRGQHPVLQPVHLSLDEEAEAPGDQVHVNRRQGVPPGEADPSLVGGDLVPGVRGDDVPALVEQDELGAAVRAAPRERAWLMERGQWLRVTPGGLT